MSSWDEYYYNEKLNKKEGKIRFHWFTQYFEMNKTTKITLKEYHKKLMEDYEEKLAYYNIQIRENNGKGMGKKPQKPPTLKSLYHYSEDFHWLDRIKDYQEFLRRKHDLESEAIFDNYLNTDMKIIKNKQNQLYELENQLNILSKTMTNGLDINNEDDMNTLSNILTLEQTITSLRNELMDLIIKCAYRGVSPSNVLINGNLNTSISNGVDNSEKINNLFEELETLQGKVKDGKPEQN